VTGSIEHKTLKRLREKIRDLNFMTHLDVKTEAYQKRGQKLKKKRPALA
jgi:hypothetical protein